MKNFCKNCRQEIKTDESKCLECLNHKALKNGDGRVDFYEESICYDCGELLLNCTCPGYCHDCGDYYTSWESCSCPQKN